MFSVIYIIGQNNLDISFHTLNSREHARSSRDKDLFLSV